MGGVSSIEWTELTWNPFVGCEIVSAGCTNCYAMRMAGRLEGFGHKPYKGTTQSSKKGRVWTGVVNRSSDRTMNLPKRHRTGSLIFVNSMSDFWNPAAKHAWRKEALDIMRGHDHHQYQILTKRPEHIAPILKEMGESVPDNAWLGCTVEDHRVVDRIDLLRQVPAKVRFLSVEPMTARLGKVDLTGIHWVILGGESGPKARPCYVDWFREVRDQCVGQGVPLFLKQWGRPENNPLYLEGGKDHVKEHDPIGKGGSLLEGKQWHQWPFYAEDPVNITPA